ncbi:hypothetical protein BESB_058810 [Besnoitia besnoiti]|uniref:RFTS domain-containing protein n=1 Tax=Besnoitia besnoiti TaxID=94643 RepID=A0A2A9MCP2_BESBE|nr:hypothetical protein BESB_058810 [Besnoitia besnoiti]PFH34994.1 hypothetical protein BESB_058810 [Besnoitia besnoiti]
MKDEGRFAVPRASASASGEGEGAPQRRSVGEGNDHDASSPGPVPRVHVSPPCSGTSNPPFAACGAASAPSFSRPGLDQDEGDGAGQGDIRCFAPSSSHSVPGGSHPVLSSDPAPRPAAATAVAGDGEALASPSPASVSPSEPCSSSCSAPACAAAGSLPSLSSPSARQPQGAAPLRGGLPRTSSSAAFPAAPPPPPSSSSANSDRTGGATLCGGPRLSASGAAPAAGASPATHSPGRSAEAARPRGRGDSAHAAGTFFEKGSECAHLGAAPGGRGASPALVDGGGGYARESPATASPASLLSHSPFFASPLQGAGATGATAGSNRPQHPLVHASTPCWVKYGEEHYPEEAVPIEYQWVEDDGTCCCYVTDFLLYNKKGERLLQVETLDQDELADVALYGKLVHVALVHPPEALEARKHPTACQVYPHLLQQRRRQQNPRSRRNLQATPEDDGAAQASPRSPLAAGPRDGGDKSAGAERESAGRGGAEGDQTPIQGGREEGERKEDGKSAGDEGAGTSSLGGKKVFRKRGGMLHHPFITPKIPRAFRTFPVRVDLTEWTIDYGKSSSQTPYVWLISSLNRYYRLEKPAGRYAPVLQSLKYKFEVASRVIKQLSVDRLYPYQELVRHLTADSRLKKALAEKAPAEGPDKEKESRSGGRCSSSGDGGAKDGELEQPSQAACATGEDGEEAGGGGGDGAPSRKKARRQEAKENEKLSADEEEEDEEKEDGELASGKASSQQVSPRNGGLGSPENEEGSNADRLKEAFLSHPSSVAGDDFDDPAGADPSSSVLSPSSRLTPNSAHPSSASNLIGGDFGNLVLPPGLGSSSSLPLDPSSLFTSSKFISALAIKKNKNCHLLSLSDPDGTGVRTLPDGSRSPESPWGAPLAVEGCTEESLIEVFPFLESQVAAFEASTGVSGLLASPFMNALRARVFRWVGKMEGDSAVDEVPPLQQTTTPEIVGGRTSEGGLLSHQPDDVLLSLNEFGASCAAEGRHPSLSGSSIPFSGAAAGGLRGAGQGFLDSPPFGGDASAQGFFTGTRGGRRRGARGGRGRGAGGEGGVRGRGGRRFPRDSDASAFARLGGDYSRDIEGLGGLTDEDARGLRDGLDGRSRMEKGERLVKREGGDGREGDEDGATREGGGGGGDLSDEEESRKRVKREEDGRSGDREPWATKDETDPQRSMDTDEEEDKDEISTVPEWGIEGDPVDVKDELDLEAEDPAYARVPLPGSSFAPYEFPELLELQDFSRVFVEMLQLPNYPVDTLEAALLLSLSSSVAEEFSARAGWPPQTKGGSKKNARKQSAKIPQNTLPFIAASTSLAPAPEPFHFFSPSARVRREEVAAAAASGEGKGAAIKTGAALRDAAAMALAEAAKEEARESGSQGALQAAEEGEGDKADDANSGFEGEAKALDAKYTAATGRAGGEASREGGRTGDPEEERTDTDPQGGESDKAVGGPSQGEAGEVEATPSPPPAKQGNDDSPLPASISDSSSPAAPQEGASAAPERSSAGAAPPSSASQTPPSVGAACCSGPLAPFSSASLLRPSSFPVFLGDALFLRLVQLAFLHISDALSRHNKTGSSATGDPANPSADARAPLVSLLTAAAGAGTGGLVGSGSVAAAASGAAGGMDTPAAATWLGAGSPNGLCGSCSSGSAPERDSKVKGEEWSGDFGRWTALKKAGTERELEGAGSRLEGGKGGPAAASTKAVVGVAMKHFWRHAALGPKLRRLVPRHADEEEEEDGEKKTTARGDQEEAATRPRKSKAGERSREEDEAAEAEAPEDEAGEADGDVAVEEGETGKEARKERKEAKREASSFCESQGDAQLEDQEPEVLQMLNNAPRDLRLIDFLTWPLVLQRMLFDSLYTPRRVDVKKPRRRRAKNEEAPQNLEAESAENKAAKVEDDGEQAQDAANEDAEGESDAQALSSGHEEGEGGESAAQAEADMESKECSDNAASCPAAVKRRSSLSSAEDAGGAEEGPPSCTPPSPYAAEVSGSAAGEASMEEQGDSADKADAKAPPAEEVDGGAEVAEVQEGDAAADCGDPEEDKRVEEKRAATPKDERDGEDAEGEEGEENEQESEAGAKQEEGGAADGEETGHPETDPDAEEDREDEKEEPQEQDAGSAFGGARGRDKKRRRDGQEDGEEELDEQGRCRKTEKDVAQKADDEEAATPAEFKPQNARKKTRRTSSDVMGDEEGESGCKGRAGGEDEDEEDEEAEEEEFERLEWHLDDQKAAQCGILPSRAEAMAIALHDLRTHSDAAVPRRLQLLQWLIACIANGWMGKFFLDAKVEALFRARANTLRLRMASVAAGPPKPLGGPTGAAAGVKGEGGETEGAAASASPEAPVPPLSTATDDTAPVDAGERAEEPSAAAASSAKAEAPPAPSSSSSSPLPNDAGDGSVSSQSMPPGEPGGAAALRPRGARARRPQSRPRVR